MSSTFFLFGGSATVSANGKISGTATISSNLSFGTHRLYMRTLDAAGNWSSTVSVTFTFI